MKRKRGLKALQFTLIVFILIEFVAFSLFQIIENKTAENPKSIYATGKATNPSCTSNWQCTTWSPCINNEQIRRCDDVNLCGSDVNKPIEKQSCGSNCVPNWQCTGWNPSNCDERGLQTRNCTDSNSCGIPNNKPEEAKSCQFSNDYSWIFIFIVTIIIIFIIGAIWILIKKLKNR